MHTAAKRLDTQGIAAFWRDAVHITQGGAVCLDAARFETADPTTAWALFQGPLPSLVWLVRGDGAVCAAWDGFADTNDPDLVRHLPHPNPIGLLLAAHAGQDGLPNGQGILHLEAWRHQDRPVWACVAANAAARALPPVSVERAEAQQDLDTFHKRWMEGMRDPFPDLTDHRPWTEDKTGALVEVARDVLLAVGLTTGTYAVGSPTNQAERLHIFDPHSWERTPEIGKASAVLAHLFDPGAFVGWTWEYNDGARDRASGYTAYSATVATIDLGNSSAHVRLGAQKRTLERLARTPDQGQAVRHLVDTGT
jgi:hypothetical protein